MDIKSGKGNMEKKYKWVDVNWISSSSSLYLPDKKKTKKNQISQKR